MTQPLDTSQTIADAASPENPLAALATQIGTTPTQAQAAWELVTSFLSAAEASEAQEEGVGIERHLDIGSVLDLFGSGGKRNLGDLIEKKLAEVLAERLDLDPQRSAVLVAAILEMLGKSKRTRRRKTASRAAAKSTDATTRSKSTGSTTRSKSTGAAKSTSSTTRSKSTGSTTRSKSTGAAKSTSSTTRSKSTGSTTRSKSTGATKSTSSTTRSKSTGSTTRSKSTGSTTKPRSQKRSATRGESEDTE
jgi:hypothetical protein